MSAEFRLSDEQREGLLVTIIEGDFRDVVARVEAFMASEVEAAERALVERIEAVLADIERVGSVNGEHLTSLRALTRPDTEATP